MIHPCLFYGTVPQVTKLVYALTPKVQAKELLDIGIGDGDTIASMVPLWDNPFVFGCDPEVQPERIGDVSCEWQKSTYDESRFFENEYDVITFFDSLACYMKPRGEEILEHAMGKAKKLLVVWTPCGYYPYPPFKSCWHPEDFLKRGFCVYQAKDIHQGPPVVADGLLAWKVRV